MISDHRKQFNCIAVDMGAGSIRMMHGAIRDEQISYREIYRFENRIVFRDGHDRWDMGRIIEGIMEGIRMGFSEAGGKVQSIGVDGWGADFVLLDRDGELVEIPVAYRDRRTEGMREKWAGVMPEMDTFQRTGINFYPFNTLFQLLSLKGSGSLELTSRILFMPCYINYLLSGSALNELTLSSTSQMLAVEGEDWDREILSELGLRPEILGKVVEPGTRLGPVKRTETSGRIVENIAVCGHDTAGVVAALPVEEPGYAYLSAGTWCILGVESERPVLTKEALDLGFTNERGYGSSYRILKNIAGLWLIQGLREQMPGKVTFEEMERMIRGGADPVQVIDPEDSQFYNPDNMKKAFDLYFQKTDQPLPEEITGYLRCAYDSLCFAFRYYIERLEHLAGRSIEVLHVVGGGSQSVSLNRRIATICRRRVVSGPVEGATLGNILVQAISMGQVASLEQGRSMVRGSFPVREYLPEREEEGIGRRYRLYLNFRRKIKNKHSET
jgi:rhamnulokinase